MICARCDERVDDTAEAARAHHDVHAAETADADAARRAVEWEQAARKHHNTARGDRPNPRTMGF